MNGCEKVYMYPSYAALTEFKSSRMASKYSIHLYREGGLDRTNILPDGVPVLFIPGNAGSYRQARSIAAYAAKFQQEQQSTTQFDFFTVDFNEDFTAFHGRTLLDQAEYLNDAISYILGLYGASDKAVTTPKAVILIGHSMGGIVARTMVALPNYIPDSVNTIITLSTPHIIPPLTFDHDINRVYELVNQYWRNSFAGNTSSSVEDMAVVSIAGGKSDTTVPSDYAAISAVIPPSNGFSTFSYSVPNVWTSIDHLAMVWCHQLRRAIVESLFQIVDTSSPSRTVSLERRMTVFARNLLSGFEHYMYLRNTDDHRNVTVSTTLLDKAYTSTTSAIRPNEKTQVIKVPKSGQYTLNAWMKSSSAILLCDAKNTNNDKVNLTCVDISSNAATIPDSQTTSAHAFSRDKSIWTFASIPPERLRELEYIVIPANSEGLVSLSQQSDVEISNSMWNLVNPVHYQLSPASAVDFSILSAINCLVSYKVRLNPITGCKAKKDQFAPFIRHYIEYPSYESRFHVNTGEVGVSFHGPGPFLPYAKNKASNLHVQIFVPELECDDGYYDVSISVDLLASIGNLVMRYRIFVTMFLTAVVAMVVAIQFRQYNNTANLLSFDDALTVLCKKYYWNIVMCLSVVHILIAEMEAFRNIVRALQIVTSSSENFNSLKAFDEHLDQNDIYLGLNDSMFFFLGPLFLTVAIGIWFVTYTLFKLVIDSSAKFFRLFTTNPSGPVEKNGPVAFHFTSRRLLVVAALVMAVNFFVPYQFALILATAAQIVNVSLSSSKLGNFYNYNFSILMILICATIVDAPIIVVWIHNLALHWSVPFSSHHNVFSILPVLLVVENISQGNMIPQMHTRLQQRITVVYLAFVAWYCLIFGFLHTYMIHHFINVFCGWLLVVYLDDPGTRKRMDYVFKKN